MKPILVIGSLGIDTIHNRDGKFPDIIGGSAYYAALSASLSAPVYLTGVVGKDFPSTEVELMRDRNIDLEGLQVADGHTFRWEGRYAEDFTSRTTLQTELNVFADFKPRLPDRYRQAEYILLGNIHPELQLEVLDQVKKPTFVMADTMNLWINNDRKELLKVLERIDALVINEEEARQLTGHFQLTDIIASLEKLGPRFVVVKRGEYGSVLWERERLFSLPAYPVERLLDPTGAGDSFAGGMIAHLASKPGQLDGDTLRQSVALGTATASYCVSGVGAEALKAATAQGVIERYREIRSIASVPSLQERSCSQDVQAHLEVS